MNKKLIKQSIKNGTIQEIISIIISYTMQYSFDVITDDDMSWIEKKCIKEINKRIDLNKDN